MTPDQLHLIELLKRIKSSDEKALEAFYNATVSRVYGLALKIVHRPELAEEIVSDVYLQVWRQAANYDEERSSPAGWLLMICRSRALDRLRREKTATMNQVAEDESQQIEDISVEAPLHELIGAELTQEVNEALQLLNQKQRQAVMLAFYQGMSHQEICDYTGDPLGTVKSNIRRAQAVLRGALEHNYCDAGGLYGEI